MRSLEERIQELEDLEAIRKLKFRYARFADEHDADSLAQLFTEDAVWEGGDEFGRHQGQQEIRAFVLESWERITWAIHLMTNGEIEIDPSGSEASGTWDLWEPATISNQAVWMVGRYVDRYRKVDGQWLISYCELAFDFMTPFESGWVKERFVGS